MSSKELFNSIRDDLFSDFLERNPAISRNELTVKYVNGYLVIDTLKNIFLTQQKQKKLIQSQKNANRSFKQHLSEYLKEETNSHYLSCVQSIKNSKRIIDILFNSTPKDFNVIEKSSTLKQLKRQESICAASTHEILRCKKELTQIMDCVDKKIGVAKSLVSEYMENTLSLLKSQCQIYNKEAQLGDKFLQFAHKIIQKNYMLLEKRLNAKSKKMLASILNTISADSTSNINPVEIDAGQMNDALKEYEKFLTGRKNKVENMVKIISYLNEIVEKIGLDQNKGEEEKGKETGSIRQPKKPVMSRMAVMKNFFKPFRY